MSGGTTGRGDNTPFDTGIGCNYVNPRSSPVYLIAADRVLYIELREIYTSLSSFVDDLSLKFVDYDAHCTYTVSFIEVSG